ncbi:DNA recombination and repair protein Rad51-like C-terminal domain-containing protein [Madurella fahalii]|uniref:DNA recombination and repair protein Rad51-like C-terminal domain-containing protein n=1 Tax=Madurella fahalii TaxID=1157608 RepID=A0ABQ0GPT6_9PEZI
MVGGMHAIGSAATASVGSRVLAEIDEANLDEILASLRKSFAAATTTNENDSSTGNAPPASTGPKNFPLGILNDLVNRHFRATQSAPLAVTGRHRELLYVLIATLIAPPYEKALAIVDFEGRFDPVRLLATAPIECESSMSPTTTDRRSRLGIQRADLHHVHIVRPARGSFRHMAECLTSIENYMLYGSHRSRSREWWGTLVIGGGANPAGDVPAVLSSQIAVTAGRKGWLRVDRPEVASFWSMGAEDAVTERDRRQAAVEGAGWMATSPWGSFAICKREGN